MGDELLLEVDGTLVVWVRWCRSIASTSGLAVVEGIWRDG